MAYPDPITAFAQSISLVVKNRYFDDIASDDGQNYIAQVVDQTNQYLDELENVTDPMGEIVDWNWMRQNGFELGTATSGENTVDLDSSVQALIANPGRYVQITVNDVLVSNWEVATAKQIANGDSSQNDAVALVSGQLVFSRAFNDDENNGLITGDVLASLPRMTTNNYKVLSIVKPKQLLILGVAKNISLPDIVQGGLSPSFVQKYNDLLTAAITRNDATSRSTIVARDSFASIRGVGF